MPRLDHGAAERRRRAGRDLSRHGQQRDDVSTLLGYPPDHPDRAIARQSVEKLLVVKDDEAYCQPCVSPVWDTALVAHALLETKDERAGKPPWRAGWNG